MEVTGKTSHRQRHKAKIAENEVGHPDDLKRKGTHTHTHTQIQDE